jgi:hypothetical protein
MTAAPVTYSALSATIAEIRFPRRYVKLFARSPMKEIVFEYVICLAVALAGPIIRLRFTVAALLPNRSQKATQSSSGIRRLGCMAPGLRSR